MPRRGPAERSAVRRLRLQDLHPRPPDLRVDQDRPLHAHRTRRHLWCLLRLQRLLIPAGALPLPAPRRGARGRRRGDPRRRPARAHAAAVPPCRLCHPGRRGPQHPGRPHLPRGAGRGRPGARHAHPADVPAGLHRLQQPGGPRQHLPRPLRARIPPASRVPAPPEPGGQRGAPRGPGPPAAAPGRLGGVAREAPLRGRGRACGVGGRRARRPRGAPAAPAPPAGGPGGRRGRQGPPALRRAQGVPRRDVHGRLLASRAVRRPPRDRWLGKPRLPRGPNAPQGRVLALQAGGGQEERVLPLLVDDSAGHNDVCRLPLQLPPRLPAADRAGQRVRRRPAGGREPAPGGAHPRKRRGPWPRARPAPPGPAAHVRGAQERDQGRHGCVRVPHCRPGARHRAPGGVRRRGGHQLPCHPAAQGRHATVGGAPGECGGSRGRGRGLRAPRESVPPGGGALPALPSLALPGQPEPLASQPRLRLHGLGPRAVRGPGGGHRGRRARRLPR
mmetsp:Transcript_111006/g.354005  ORF Transcript_111006/g.354005 Transcript_111006/m.354005 type:complete len:502 (+) Transcript_111006:426-1931(+)